MKIFTTYGYLDENLVSTIETKTYEDEYVVAKRQDKYIAGPIWVGNDIVLDIKKGKEITLEQASLT